MRKLTTEEKAHRDSLCEIRQCASIVTEFEDEGTWDVRVDGAASVVAGLPGWDGVILGPNLERERVSVSRLGSCWRTTGTARRLDGEFSISDVFECLLQRPPELGWDGSPPEEAEFYSELRVIDDTPRTANGLLAALRVRPGVDPLEVWYYDKDLSRAPGREHDCLRMDVDYSGYLDALLLTKGTFGWQYLFTEVSFRDEYFSRYAADLAYMLELFPQLFPAHDYSDLRARLEARL